MKERPLIDKLWNYGKPEETATKFKELLETSKDAPLEYLLEIKTQLARTQSLQRKFDEAHKILDAIKEELSPEMTVVRIRYCLERGRTHNSNNEKEEAIKLFDNAFKIANDNQQDFYTIDAAHMLGIAHPYPDSLKWNETAKQVAENSQDERARNWLGSLYNNIGWTYHDKENYKEAMINFEKALTFRENTKIKNDNAILIAKWCVGRCQRSLGQLQEALATQLEVKKEREEKELISGYVYEELGELYLLLDEMETSKRNFKKAHELISQDGWMVANEKKRLDRMLELSK